MLSFLTSLDGGHFLFRWMHVFFGVVWIGHLYYFNFVQGAFLAETDAGAKSQVLQKLAPRALWWFRWGAMWTFITGLFMLSLRGHQLASAQALDLNSSYWINILSGAIMGILMFLNVWLVIWPKQQIVIANAKQTASGGAAIPEAAAAAARAGVASRTNTLFSIPMLFFMLSAMHLPYAAGEGSHVGAYWALFLLIVGGIEANALIGKSGPMTTIKGVVTCGFILTAVFVVLNIVTI